MPLKASLASAAAKTPRKNLRRETWRHNNVGRYLHNALARFEGRVVAILEAAGHEEVRQSLLALTRNLDVGGTRANELARRAGMTRQAMSELIAQAELVGLVTRTDDPTDGRAKVVRFSPRGEAWLRAFRRALDKAAKEMMLELGEKRYAVIMQALRLYGQGYDTLQDIDEP